MEGTRQGRSQFEDEGPKRDDVPVSEWVAGKVMAQRKVDARQDSDLIFLSARGVVDTNLIRITQRIAEVAGVKGSVDNHKFRATAITMWLPDGKHNFRCDDLGWP
jgi:hypothetical protein